MNKIKKNISAVILLVLGIILSLSPFNLFKVCTKLTPMGTYMKCHYSGLLFLYTGIALIILALLVILINKKIFTAFAGLLTIAIASADYLIPRGIIKVGDMKTLKWEVGFCKMDKMRCIQNTKGSVTIIIGIILILGIALILKSFLSQDR